MFANTQMTGPVDFALLRSPGLLARRTTDPKTLRVLRAGLEAMLQESKNVGAFPQDHAIAESDLQYLKSKTG